MAIPLLQRPDVSASDIDTVGIDYGPYLRAGEYLDGTPTVTQVSDDGTLTINNVSINSTSIQLLIDGVLTTCPANTVVLFSVTSFTSGYKYRIRVTVDTDSTPARRKVVDVIINCV